jgi:hypothetical protein
MPAGLSTSSRPSTREPPTSPERSVVLSSPRRSLVLSLDVGEQRLDAGRPRNGVIFLELDLWRHTESELARDPRPQVRRNAVESIEGSLLLSLASEHAYVNARVPEVGTDFSPRDRHEADDPRIFGRFGEECRDLYANRFGDAVRSAGVTQKRPPPK